MKCKIKLIKLLFILEMFFLISCGGGGSSGGSSSGGTNSDTESTSSPAQATNLDSLSGVWTRDCGDNPLPNANPNLSYASARLEYSGSDETLFLFLAAGAPCSSILVRVRRNSTVTLGGNTTTQEGKNATEINRTPSEVTLTPLSAFVANQMNLLEQCGMTNWQSDQEQSVLGTVCAEGFESMEYDIIFLENDRLQIGDIRGEKDGTTETNRRDQLDVIPFDRL